MSGGMATTTMIVVMHLTLHVLLELVSTLLLFATLLPTQLV